MEQYLKILLCILLTVMVAAMAGFVALMVASSIDSLTTHHDFEQSLKCPQ